MPLESSVGAFLPLSEPLFSDLLECVQLFHATQACKNPRRYGLQLGQRSESAVELQMKNALVVDSVGMLAKHGLVSLIACSCWFASVL